MKKNIEEALLPGEAFVWRGAPNMNKRMNRADRVLVPVSIACLALSVTFTILMALSVKARGFGALYGLLTLLLLAFGGLSVYACVFRFVVKKRTKRELTYGVTNRRRLIICDGRKMTAYEPDKLTGARITESDDSGNGTIYIRPKDGMHRIDNCGLDIFAPVDGTHIALFDVDECRKVLKKITGIRHGAK